VCVCVCDGVFVCLELFLTLLREYQWTVHKIMQRAILQGNLKGEFYEVSFRARHVGLSILGKTKTKNKYMFAILLNQITSRISKQNTRFL
jgi:hypothetical protein